MRTVEEIRAHFLERLALALKRPGMFGGPNIIRELLNYLVFIDENEKSYETLIAEERFVRYFGPGWIAAPFWWKFGGKYDRYANEVSSVYAEIAYQLGYAKLDRNLDAGEWRSLRKGSRKRIQERDWTVSDVVQEFGPSSFRTGLTWQQILCYSNGVIGDEWVFFDFEAKQGDEWPLGSKWPPEDFKDVSNPPLRNVRLPAKDFSHSLVLTPFGRTSAILPIQY